MTHGTIKTLLNRGFGFITPDSDKNQDVFFHSSTVADDGFERLREGMRVSYQQEADPRDASRQRAAQVTPLTGADE
ncbi:MAG TPA: cold shock domain-containing protein [Thermomicrobiales bacterium]|nr:cold shock domain-containing protein [Thermomicrobiales bacterium]